MKAVIVTMVYANDQVFGAGMNSLYTTVDMEEYDHLLVNCHYPLNPPNVEKFAADNGAEYLNLEKNEGLHKNANRVLAHLSPSLSDADIVVFYDADEGALQKGWLEAMTEVFRRDPFCGWLSLNAQPILDNLNTSKTSILEVGGVRLRIPGYPLMNLICGWRVGALRAIGPLNEPHEWYGGLEMDAQPKFNNAGYWVGWLEDYLTQPHTVLADPEYTKYKKHHVGFEQPGFPGSFEEWLK